jgi:isopentenyl-diphosphate delta-isomerase
MEEQVVLVDEQNNVLGTTPKATVHTQNTPLHRGFSVFLFNKHKQFLVTQRATSKKTFPGVFTNSFCGHPALDETAEQAAERRVTQELGIHNITILKTLPYRYSCTDVNGIQENEICPVMIAITNEEPVLNKEEVEQYYWQDWNDFLADQQKNPDKYSLWSKQEAQLVAKVLPI